VGKRVQQSAAVAHVGKLGGLDSHEVDEQPDGLGVGRFRGEVEVAALEVMSACSNG
jgi:hypothetical protein